jgi:putative intracellular protease/amidase
LSDLNCKGAFVSIAFNVSTTKPKRVAIVVSKPAVSKETGWPIGFWWAEVVHPYWEFVQNGYDVEIFSPDGGNSKATNGAIPATIANTQRRTS